MRGASTPFQFLDRSSEDFVEVEDASMGLLMIQSKSSAYEEQLKKIIKVSQFSNSLPLVIEPLMPQTSHYSL